MLQIGFWRSRVVENAVDGHIVQPVIDPEQELVPARSGVLPDEELVSNGGLDGGQVSVDGCEAEWYKRHRETIGSLPPTEKQIEENTNKNKFSFKVVFKYVTKTLDRFKTDDRLTESARTKVDQAIGLINDAIEEMDSSLEKID